jgi:hypothetical protein
MQSKSSGTVARYSALEGSTVREQPEAMQSHRNSQSGKEEESHAHIGFGHLEAIGGASASLGLISTLVFSLCIGSLSDVRFEEMPFRMTLLCVATTFSTYTTCYSLLEYYYVQMFMGVERYLQGRVDRDDELIVKDRAELVAKVRQIFSTFNVRRGAARNSMWLGLLSLVLAAATQVNPVEDFVAEVCPSAKIALFFFMWLLLVGPAWYVTGAPDFAMYSWICIGGGTALIIETLCLKTTFHAAKFVAFSILMSNIVLVPSTVLSFRKPLLPLVKQYVNVF